MVDEHTQEMLRAEMQMQMQQAYDSLKVSLNSQLTASTRDVSNEIRAEVQADKQKLETKLGEHLESIQGATLRAVSEAGANASTSASDAMKKLETDVGIYYNERMESLKKEVAVYSQTQIERFEKKAVVERDRAQEALTLVENNAMISVQSQGALITGQLQDYVEGVKGEDQRWKRDRESELSNMAIMNGQLNSRLDDKERTIQNQHARLAQLESDIWQMERVDPVRSDAIKQAVDRVNLIYPDFGKLASSIQSLIQTQGDMQNECLSLRQMIMQQGMYPSTTQGGQAGYQGGGGGGRPRTLNVSQFTKTLVKWSGGQERNGTRTDPVSWLYKFNSLAEIEGLSGPERGRVIVFLLEGSALDWYNSQTDAVRDEWQTLSQHFLNEYTVRNEQEEAGMKLTSIRESHYIAAGKDFRAFQDAFRGLCNKAGTAATESQRVQSYIMALDNQKIRNDLMEAFLSSKKVGSVPLVLHQVIEMSEDKKLATQASERSPAAVQQMTRANMAAPVQGAASDAGSIGPSVSQVGAQGQMDLDALHSMQAGYSRYAAAQNSIPFQSSSRNDGYSEVGSVPSVRVDTSSTISALSQQMAEISEGLNAFNEKSRSSASRQETRECYNCGIKGHLIAECRKPPKNGTNGAAPRSASQEARDRNAASGQYEKRGNTPTRAASPGGTPYSGKKG
jgi:hypothetical protein